MSFSNLNIGTKIEDFKTSEVFDSYGRVDIVMGEDEQGDVYTISFPNIPDEAVPGRILTVQMPMCTDSTLARTAAQRIYNSLTTKDDTSFQYAPMQATGALADPSMEFGDSVDINGVHSGFYVRVTEFGHLMRTDLSSPCDEEIDHEYPYQDSARRQINRTNKELKAGLYVTAQAITAEVAAREAGDRALNSTIEQTASQIRAEVVAKEGGNTSSFGWKLLANEFGLYANGQKVFWVNRDGANIKGTLQVGTSVGSSNGFVISANAIYKNISSYGATPSTGVYIGTDGIQLGQNFKVNNRGQVTARDLEINGGTINMNNRRFYVDNSGNVEARSLKLYGQLKLYDANGGNEKTISADTLAQGAADGYSWAHNSSYDGYSSNASYALAGAGSGISAENDWSNARDERRGAGTIYGEFRGSHYGNIFMPYGYSYKQIGLTSRTIHDGDTVQFVTWS